MFNSQPNCWSHYRVSTSFCGTSAFCVVEFILSSHAVVAFKFSILWISLTLFLLVQWYTHRNTLNALINRTAWSTSNATIPHGKRKLIIFGFELQVWLHWYMKCPMRFHRIAARNWNLPSSPPHLILLWYQHSTIDLQNARRNNLPTSFFSLFFLFCSFTWHKWSKLWILSASELSYF